MDENKKKTNAKHVMAAVTGAIVGIGIGAAATKTLSDKKTRKKMGVSIDGIKRQMMNVLDINEKEIPNKKEELKKEIENKKEDVKKT